MNLRKTNNWTRLKRSFLKKPIVFLGELHGAKANIRITKLFVTKLKPKVILFEWPSSWNITVRNYLKNRSANEPLRKFATLKDGKISKEHLELIQFLNRKGINIYCVDNPAKNWSLRDRKIAYTIRKVIGTARNLSCLVVMGNLHARKKMFRYQGRRLMPTGTYFKKTAIFILIRYGSGSIYNFSKMPVMDAEVMGRLYGKENCLLTVARDRNFDYEVLVRKTGTVTPISTNKKMGSR